METKSYSIDWRRLPIKRPYPWERNLTVGIAALFRWNYGTKEKPLSGLAGIALTDRMITSGDVQYEPDQKKVGFLTRRCFVLIAGDYSTHTQAIYKTTKELADRPDAHPNDVANCYGRAIRGLKTSQAESMYLAPLGMNTDTFMAQQRDLSPDFVQRVTDQLQGHRGDEVEALIVGGDGTSAHIYHIDNTGMVSCPDDVGFSAIGMGAWHARSRLMQSGYVNTVVLAQCLAATYQAKKSSEFAPGVGRATDIHLIFKDRIENLRTDIFDKLSTSYDEYEKERVGMTRKYLEEFGTFISTRGPVDGTVLETPSDEKSDPDGKEPK